MCLLRPMMCGSGIAKLLIRLIALRRCVRIAVVAAIMTMSAGSASADETGGPPVHPLDCGYRSSEQVLSDLRNAVAAGQIEDPTTKRLPIIPPGVPRGNVNRGGGVPTVLPADIFPFEDSNSVLTSNFSDGQLFNLMISATNAVLASHGDNFDFVAFFLNFVPHHQIGGAFYAGLENNVNGIGLTIFNSRPALGIGGVNVEGWVMMWNQANWPTGSNTFTQLVLGQEFEHRFALFLNGMPGRPFQGNNGSCGRVSHWNFALDAQGSGMEIPEWIGSSPANRLGGNLNFNTDLGGVFSYPDLYLMGYVSGNEMDTQSSELRYMDSNPTCSSPHNGSISTWSSADIVASNGPRVPDSASAQQDFRTAWVMIHLPGSPPTGGQLGRVVSILNDWSEIWESSTLGRGTMDNTLIVNPPQPVDLATPNDRLKNRYVSFKPGNAGRQVKLKVTLTTSLPHPGSVGDAWWVQAPVVTVTDQFPRPLVGVGECVALLGPEATAAEMDWDAAGCETLHVAGCPIEPTSEYDVQVVSAGVPSVALNVPTVPQPRDGKFWGDTVGIFNGTEWTKPQGTLNIDDAVVVINTFQGGQVVAPIPGSSVAHLSVADVEPGNINTVVNFADVLILIKAFQGDVYPFGPADTDGNCP